MPIVCKPDGTLVVRMSVTLKPGRDDALIDLVMGADNLAATVREAMRNGVVQMFEVDPEDDQNFDFDLGIEL